MPGNPPMATTFLKDIWTSLGGGPGLLSAVTMTGEGDLPSAFAVSDLAAGSVAAAGLAVAELLSTRSAGSPSVEVDRRLASFWFGTTLRPLGWSMPPPWDPVAGDYAAADGWIRLHTNAPHHREAALKVLRTPAEKDAVTAAVSRWRIDDLEASVVESGGCAAAMRDLAAWAGHPHGKAVATEPLARIEETDGGPMSDWQVSGNRPLAGIRVLDLTRVLAGPVATRFLAGFGAEVLRIDPPEWDEPGVIPEVTLGKRCARLDLRRPDDRRAFEDLLASADVLVHGYRPGALKGLGLDEAARQKLRPGLVDVSLDAYGWSGPWRERRGFDSLVQMSSGIAAEGMRRFGADKPRPLPVQALDHATGYIMAAGVVRGLVRRLTKGVGSRTRTSLARTAALLTNALAVDRTRPFEEANDADFETATEATGWGLARRMKPPLDVDGAGMRWDHPANPLGSSEPGWTTR
ncbi:MAG: CoA transferase [Acetobacteraceae bacterium]|jgi:crotonobetainyl-CoA:carnitine CoA-transferase CaiB-like acyl-CoA transferase